MEHVSTPAACPAVRSPRRGLFLLLGAVSFALLAGAGCNHADEDAALTPLACTASSAIPASANPQGLNASGRMKSAVLIEQIQTALAASEDVQLLIGKYHNLGFEWTPTSTDFVAGIDSDGTPLVGIAHRRDATPTRRAWLVAQFPLNSSPFAQPRYLYVVTYDHEATSPLVRYWVNSGVVQCKEELPPNQPTLQAPAGDP